MYDSYTKRFHLAFHFEYFHALIFSSFYVNKQTPQVQTKQNEKKKSFSEHVRMLTASKTVSGSLQVNAL